jgi:hypothetical protein
MIFDNLKLKQSEICIRFFIPNSLPLNNLQNRKPSGKEIPGFRDPCGERQSDNGALIRTLWSRQPEWL